MWFRDGTSIVLSDEVGQIYIIATGQGESQKDAKYDQVFASVVSLCNNLVLYCFLFCDSYCVM